MDRPEEFEHVPWSELAAGVEQRRGRLAYVLAAAIVAVAVGAVVARAVWPAGAPVEETGPTVTDPPAVPADEPAATVTTLPEAELYSEADLLAARPAPAAELAAVARAEWFVFDFFTSDGDPGGSLDLRRALPAGAQVTLAQDAPVAAISYVEWARAMSVEDLGPGLFAVDVAFRAIGGPPEGPLVRMPVRAVRVVVAGDRFGMSVADLPSPVPLPAELGAEPWPAAKLEAPEAVAAAALEAAAAWGDGAAVLGASSADGGWRVLVEVDDEAGNRWPLAVWRDDVGEIPAPPWVEPLHSGP